MNALSLPASRESRLAVALLVGAVIAVTAVFAVPTWYLYHRYDRELADRQEKADRFARIAGTRPEIARQLEAMRDTHSRKFFLRSGAAALSVAEAQEIVRGIVESSG